ncbi:unnamed protein product [Miscanthus lutarioriparius]|uniref:HIG1 domain-containing protein n=1 Tax=Miscanthus lutarioriparius TaxID=422564 RepID=A0A811N5H5_9POAL|nr:unnamed protein product [Miscanthus lutarioriparius]
MAEEKGALQSAREWVVEHKLRAVGTLWLSGIVGSIAYNWSRPGMKTSVKIIHARFGIFQPLQICTQMPYQATQQVNAVFEAH